MGWAIILTENFRHDVAEVGGVAAFSIGEEDVDRRVIIYKKEFAPSDEELAALRRGEEWDPEKAKLEAEQVIYQLIMIFDFGNENLILNKFFCYRENLRKRKKKKG